MLTLFKPGQVTQTPSTTTSATTVMTHVLRQAFMQVMRVPVLLLTLAVDDVVTTTSTGTYIIKRD